MVARKSYLKADIVIIYQDSDTIKHVIEQVRHLNLSFHPLKFSADAANELVAIQPKILLFSSNQLIKSIEFYVSFLEKHAKKMSQHRAILLTGHKDYIKAFVACENGLFDDYAIISPLNDPHRLTLILLKSLQLVNTHNLDGLSELMANGELELASCISHGLELKEQLLSSINQCESSIVETTKRVSQDETLVEEVERAVKEELNQLTGVLNNKFGQLIEQLLDVDKIQRAVTERIAAPHQSHSININGEQATATLTDIDKPLSSDSERTNNNADGIERTIIIAEPSELFAKVLGEIFEAQGFKIIYTQDGPQTLLAIKKHQPDALLTEYELPKLNGLDLTTKLRTLGFKLPIVALTQAKHKPYIVKWIPLGLNAYLVKPSSRSAILNTVLEEIKNPWQVLEQQLIDGDIEIKWHPQYSVGHSEMDKHHQILFSLVNKFFHSHDDPDVLSEILAQLTHYIGLHFSAEEQLMAQIHYPKLAIHQQQHQDLVDKVEQVVERVDFNDVDSHNRVAMFLYKWLAKHILKSDMDYKNYL
ncbi:bacteriohemerythrin [Psychrobium sp. 1_MG-2023]|uniref:bacteriohemerythrin n=1 Tax=Psychrobium sp. 1_MG-2023 TaxID=3062624 RepID=UPI000C347900|nr:bacteriohemerythrin [Psychrobium sp. 1_MG-2023]MDP2560634.1 bacteriohemerythrin [Psychrobium sp. 1_MG-2023]PKF57619.1 hypothetical protein CW748_06960 [Alteromonadales bacterium alter-6D02]